MRPAAARDALEGVSEVLARAGPVMTKYPTVTINRAPERFAAGARVAQLIANAVAVDPR